MIIKKCIGCGAILQDKEIDKMGYTPVINDKTLYCKRCFRLNHYSEMPKILANNELYEFVIDDLLKKKGLIILIVDLFDFTGSFIPSILEKLRNRDVILVANKFDLLPQSVKVNKIVDWLSYMVNRMFFRVLGIHVVSSKKGYFLDDLMNTIDIARKENDVYFMGCANVGKSSLINALLKRFTSRCDDLISTSSIPGTTLGSITIPFFSDNKAFIDTPGLINENNILNKLDPISYKHIVPKNEIKPITYQLEPNNTVFISGLVNISLVSEDKVGMTFYFSDELLIHRTKMENKENFKNKHLGEMLNPPTVNELNNLKYKTYEFNIKGDKKQDIVISGLGFITPNKPCKVILEVVLGTDVFLRNAIIGN